MNNIVSKVAIGIGLCALILLMTNNIFFKQEKNITDNVIENSDNSSFDQQLSTDHSPVCDLLSQKIADTILKTNALQAVYNTPTSCSYTSNNPETGTYGIITMMDNITYPEKAKEMSDIAQTGMYENLTEPIPGLTADYAFYATNFEQLSMVKGAHWILITASSSAYETDKEAAIATAKLVLENIE